MARKLTHDIVAQRFENFGLKLLSQYINSKTKVLVLCKCGKKFQTLSCSVMGGYTRSCGCYNKRRIFESNSKNITNKRFDRLVAIEPLYSNIQGVFWLCECNCGNYNIVSVHSLISHNTKSCGCLDIEVATKRLLALHPFQKGKDNPNYNHNLTDEERLESNLSVQRLEWTKQVFKRDNYTCQICKSIGKNLHSHHLDGWHWCQERRFDITNGITLCSICHNDFHNHYGRKNNIELQFRQYMKDKDGESFYYYSSSTTTGTEKSSCCS